MEEYALEKYNLIINDMADNTCSCSIKKVNEGEIALALKNEQRKIYIITTFKNEVLYVGEAHTSIKTRIQRGCTSFNYFIKGNKPRGGYKGYKWLDKNENKERNLIVYVAIFSGDYDGTEKRKVVEAIEGELVYLIRKEKGYWPIFQNEIHFSNETLASSIANSLFKKSVLREINL